MNVLLSGSVYIIGNASFFSFQENFAIKSFILLLHAA